MVRATGCWAICTVALLFAVSQCAHAGDWPTWRYDAQRSAASPHALPRDLHAQWVRRLPSPMSAWPASQGKLQFDASYEPVVMGQRLFVGSMISGRVTAYDLDTGAELWRFYTDGPVRFAPAAADGKVYVASDDGHLYCLDAASGTLRWKFRGGPSDRRGLGNDRMISTWPARGGPVLTDGMVYFAAGIWPFMGIFLHAIDAETGRVVWTNSGSGSTYTVQQHDSPAFAGAAPQGYLAVAGESLIVSGGRTVPAVYRRADGSFRYFHVASREFSNSAGGYEVVAARELFFNGGAAYRLDNGAGVFRFPPVVAKPAAKTTVVQFTGSKSAPALVAPAVLPVATAEGPVALGSGTLTLYGHKGESKQVTDSKGAKKEQWSLPVSQRASLDAVFSRLLFKAGDRFYLAGAGGRIAAIEIDAEWKRARTVWQGKVDGEVFAALAANGRLLVVTYGGAIHCFGEKPRAGATHDERAPVQPPRDDQWSVAAAEVLQQPGAAEGYGLVLGVGSGRLIEELLRQSSLRLVVIEPNTAKAASLRERFDDAGLLGSRLAIHAGEPGAFTLPPYWANLVVGEDSPAAATDAAALARWVFRSLRPYGGRACLRLSDESYLQWQRALSEGNAAGARLAQRDGWSMLAREGALPDAGDWTHQYADVGNSVVGADARVKTPLGLLWFGGPENEGVLPRHGHGPAPHVIGGRLIIQGRDMLRAVDVYTGRLLWQCKLENLGEYYDNTSHQPGANEVGSNYASAADGIYVAYGAELLRLDPTSGTIASRWPLPPQQAADGGAWGYVGVYEDLLIATACPMDVKYSTVAMPGDKKKTLTIKFGYTNAKWGAGSRWLLVLDRHTGKVLWQREASREFRHNTIVAGGGKVFCIDGRSEPRQILFHRPDATPAGTPTVYAIDARSGATIWKADKNVFGTWLGYSSKHDVLLQAGSYERDRAADERSTGMVAYRALDGRVLWKNDLKHAGPCLLHGRTIIAQTQAFDLLTGQKKTRQHPLSGEAVEWSVRRNYGCNTIIGCEHLLTFRSAAAGFYDLAADGGTGNFGGFKSGCTSSLIAANGVLNAPDYTRTCTCSYQNQCSLALVHDPDVEMWTFNALPTPAAPLRRLAVNLGAPGDRMHGAQLWLEWPIVGGPTPEVSIVSRPTKPETFRMHASQVEPAIAGPALPWVAASGVMGLERLTITVGDKQPRRYTVRLHFAEPVAEQLAGQRLFSVRLQGKKAIDALDIVTAAGGPRRAITREFRGVEVTGDLQVDFVPNLGAPLLCGIEVVAE
jgi:outer membrane protein assembly factor BamB